MWRRALRRRAYVRVDRRPRRPATFARLAQLAREADADGLRLRELQYLRASSNLEGHSNARTTGQDFRSAAGTRMTERLKPPFSEKRSWSRATRRLPTDMSSHTSAARGGASANFWLHTLHDTARAAPPPSRRFRPRGIDGSAPALSRPIWRCHRRRQPAWTNLPEPAQPHGAINVDAGGASSSRAGASDAYLRGARPRTRGDERVAERVRVAVRPQRRDAHDAVRAEGRRPSSITFVAAVVVPRDKT